MVQGTYVKTGKQHTGLASWYAQPQHLKNQYPSITGYYAANPWLPKGSYVRVTNKDNGKAIVAVINDRGPFVPDRIIDLDKLAFSKIASIGAGVANIRMEEVKN
ncbi:MAG: septal ring lytic transglycosylase RlpA family protein [Candidatus Moranbacteria bacterium]|nr:septal ring lytic transglycosylase RlpA family protein [Candidatus Moranbacteria bacterium]